MYGSFKFKKKTRFRIKCKKNVLTSATFSVSVKHESCIASTVVQSGSVHTVLLAPEVLLKTSVRIHTFPVNIKNTQSSIVVVKLQPEIALLLFTCSHFRWRSQCYIGRWNYPVCSDIVADNLRLSWDTR